MLKAEDLAKHYQQFDVSNRILLTGHSHQAWPDVALDGQKQAWLDAAKHVDDKWNSAFEKAEQLKLFYANLLGDSCSVQASVQGKASNYALASNTHELLIRFLSSLNLNRGDRIITTDGEFHSMRRQLSRLQEEGIDIVRIAASPVETLTERIAAAISDKTVTIMLSAVMFKSSNIVPHIKHLADKAEELNIPLLIDAYHALNVTEFSIAENNLEQAFIVGGGYKYCQFGEGNCFLRIPHDCTLRPVITGWYAEFGALDKTSNPDEVQYASGGSRFQGSTYDPTSHYRACSVIDFFNEQQLTPSVLRKISQYQIGLLRDQFDALNFDPSKISRADVELSSIAGFLALKTTEAELIQKKLMERGILTDQRDGYLRLGPAPYVTDTQLKDALLTLKDIV